MNPNRAKNMRDPVQSDPKVRTFVNAYTTLGLPGITMMSQADATLLDNIQKDIRFQLRRLGAASLSN